MAISTLRRAVAKRVRPSLAPCGASTAATAPCPVCAENVGLVVASKDRQGSPLKTISCVRCGLVRIDPLPTPEELQRFYEREYRRRYKGVRQPKLKHVYRSGVLAAERLHRLAGHLREHAKVLDVGCGSGEWLYALGATGRRAVGIEADPAYSAFGRHEYGVEIRTGPLSAQVMPGEKFDCVTLFHVLEHLPNPVEVLEQIHRWTSDDSVLVIEVPNINSIHQHPGKRFHYAHVLGFTPESLAYTVHKSGWGLVEFSLDAYERNIFAIARKRGSVETAEASGSWLGPNGEPAIPLVSSMSATIRYYLRPSTYARWIKRIGQFAAEFRAIQPGLSARAVLQSALAGRLEHMR